jgi:cation diffusion facilitator CzcD-associated flavoprotein CzcO
MTATTPAPGGPDRALPARTRVVVVGSGFAGIATAVRLLERGTRDVVVLERGDDVGGTWRDNSYPGCACDVPSHMYSLSFAPNPDWTRAFSPQPEIQAYLRRTARELGVLPHVHLSTELTGAHWDDAAQVWHVETSRGALVAEVLVLGTGGLSDPSVPSLPGLESFRGTTFHSATWDHGHDLTGERVAVVGTGASAIQFVPHVQRAAAHLTLFQRTAPWVLPKPDREVPARLRRLYRLLPPLQKLQRALIYGRNETLVGGFLKPKRMALIEKIARIYLDRKFADRPDLKAKVTPDFTIGCKRILLSNDYYSALKRDNVEVVTDKVVRVTENAVVTAEGTVHEVDAIILGTGFKVADGMSRVAVTGRDGVKLADAWRDGAEAFLGTTIAGFPNLFMIVGPNTGLGHSSMVYMIESQVNYLVDALRVLDEHGATALDTRRDRQQAFNTAIQDRLDGSVWSQGGCASWYLDEHGRNRTLWPDYTFRFRNRTRKVDVANHELVA